MTARKPGARRGRPPKDFQLDPHRLVIAIAIALQLLGMSENTAFALVAALVLGRKIGEHDAPPRRQRGIGAISAGRLETYARAWHLNANTASFKGFRTTLRKKLSRINDPKDRLWLAATAKGIAAFLTAGYALNFDFEQLLRHVVVLADRATAGTLPPGVSFMGALGFEPTPELVTKDNPMGEV